MSEKQKLEGGNMNMVYKDGSTVIRSQGKWSPTIQRLLLHLENVDFTACPKFLGINDHHQEVLTFVEGDCLETYPDRVDKKKHIEGLRILGEKMRKLHDATTSFVQRETDVWMVTYPGPLEKEVICHNDIAPYNVIFKNQMPHKFIDFDTSCPAPRIWDIVYALYRFVPFYQTADSVDWHHKSACVASFFQAYGMACPENLFVMMQERLSALADFILQEANKGNACFKKMLDEGHRDLYLSEIAYIKENQKNWES